MVRVQREFRAMWQVGRDARLGSKKGEQPLRPFGAAGATQPGRPGCAGEAAGSCGGGTRAEGTWGSGRAREQGGGLGWAWGGPAEKAG